MIRKKKKQFQLHGTTLASLQSCEAHHYLYVLNLPSPVIVKSHLSRLQHELNFKYKILFNRQTSKTKFGAQQRGSKIGS
jgi:hypothetical protein